MFEKFQLPWSESSTKNQYIAVLIVNILTLIHGCAIGWTSPMISILKSNETHLETGVVNTSETSLIGSLIFLGALIGIFTVEIVADAIGKKNCLVVMTFPSFIFWIRTIVSTDVYDFYIARTVAGLTGGALLRIVPLFIKDIADSKMHAKFYAYSDLSMSFGIFVMFILGSYVSYFIIPLVILPTLVLFFVFMIFLPETPQYLLQKSKDVDALKSLQFYRNCNGKNIQEAEGVRNELEVMTKIVFNDTKNEVKLKDFMENSSLFGLAKFIVLGMIVSCSGFMTVLTYTMDILQSTSSSFAAKESSIMVAFSYFVGITISNILLSKFSKKILLRISCVSSGLSLLVFACYLQIDVANESLRWIPVASLSCSLLMSGIGISAVPTLLIHELVSQKIRETTQILYLGTVATFTFANLKVFPILIESINMSNCMFIYAGINLLGGLFSILLVPNTQCKN